MAIRSNDTIASKLANGVDGMTLPSPTTQLLRAAVHSALQFSIDSGGFDGAQNAVNDPLEGLHASLREQFFSRIYVDRPALTQALEAALGERQMVILTGARGAGKSTLLARMQRELTEGETVHPSLREGEAHFVEYVNLREHVLDMHGVPSAAAVVDSALIEKVWIRFFKNESDSAPWVAFRVLNTPEHAPLRRQMAASRSDFWESPELVEAAVKDDPHLVNLLQEADSAFYRSPPSTQLRLMLKYLATSGRRRFTFIVDNVDRFASPVQAEVAQHLQQLTHSGLPVTIVLGIREHEMSRAEKFGAFDGVSRVVNISDNAAVQRDSLGMADVISRRLDFALEAVPEYLARAGHAVDTEDPRYLEFVQGVSQVTGQRDLDELYVWHNASIRSATSYVASFVDRFLGARAGEQWLGELSVPDVRLLVPLHEWLVLGQLDRTVPGASQSILRFDNNAGDLLAFPLLRILQYLRTRQNSTFESLSRDMGRLGLDEHVLIDLLGALVSARGWESEGFVHVEPIDELGRSGDVRVVIQPAGVLLVDRLVHSVDYLVLTAMVTPRHHWPQGFEAVSNVVQAVPDLLNPYVRAAVALLFMEGFVAPRALERHSNSSSQLSTNVNELHKRLFAVPTWGDGEEVLAQALNSTRRFLKAAENSKESNDFAASIEESLFRLELVVRDLLEVDVKSSDAEGTG